MDRIPYLFDTTNRAARRISVAAVILAAIAALVFPASSPKGAFAEEAATAATKNEEPLFDLGCAQRDLDLITLLERNGDGGLSTTATLVEASDILQTARAACSVGDIDSAHALYDTGRRRLENPSDIARR